MSLFHQGRGVRVCLAALCSSFLAGAGSAGQPADIGERIDAHAHVFNPSPEIPRMLERLKVRVVNLCVVDKYERGYEEATPQHAMARKVSQDAPQRVLWVSTFDPQDWESPGFAERAIKALDETFRQGAVGVKIYKSIGMDLKSRAGAYLMPDDPVFDPIFRLIAERNRTLYAHLAEPIAAWQPLDPASPDYGYYANAPAWHMYGHPERPAKETILAARDRMLERNPGLRVVGAHLGSMEEDVDEIAKRLERYQNFVVDTAARVTHLMIQPREKVRDFLIRYQDRVLYATDLVVMEWENPVEAAARWEREYDRDYRFFATDQLVEYQGRSVRGLALPPDVLKKFYRENAIRWVPGIASGMPDR